MKQQKEDYKIEEWNLDWFKDKKRHLEYKEGTKKGWETITYKIQKKLYVQ